MGKPKGESRGLEFLKSARPKAIENLLAFFAESARHLDPKTRFLISVVTKVIAGSERGLQQYVRRAVESGATPDEVIDAVLCAYPCAGLTKVVDAIDTILDMGVGGIALPGGGGTAEAAPARAPAVETQAVEAPPIEASPVAAEAVGTAAGGAGAENGQASPEEVEPAEVEPGEEELIWISAGQIADIPPISGRRVIAGDEDIAVFCFEGEVLAIENRCPHKGGSLSEGVCAEGIVTCPLHQWRFDLRSGQCPERPKAAVRTFPVRREGDQILVGVVLNRRSAVDR